MDVNAKKVDEAEKAQSSIPTAHQKQWKKIGWGHMVVFFFFFIFPFLFFFFLKNCWSSVVASVVLPQLCTLHFFCILSPFHFASPHLPFPCPLNSPLFTHTVTSSPPNEHLVLPHNVKPLALDTKNSIAFSYGARYGRAIRSVSYCSFDTKLPVHPPTHPPPHTLQ